MGSVGIWQLVLVLVIVLIIFGPGKLPDIGKSLGKAISEFKNSVTKSDKGKGPEDEAPPQS